MHSYIFLTVEGYTYQPNSESIEPDIENLQVIGFAKGIYLMVHDICYIL